MYLNFMFDQEKKKDTEDIDVFDIYLMRSTHDPFNLSFTCL